MTIILLNKFCYALLILSIFCLISCTNISTPPVDSTTIFKNGSVVALLIEATIGDYIVDTSGAIYKKLANKRVVNGITVIELWEKVKPVDTNRWYTPTLTSEMLTNDPPMFNSIGKFPLETVN